MHEVKFKKKRIKSDFTNYVAWPCKIINLLILDPASTRMCYSLTHNVDYHKLIVGLNNFVV